jgi:uncharacterized membrane protein
MAFCKACGAEVGGAAFCPKCGANQGAVQAAPAVAGSSESPTAGMEENVAGLLCYLFGWISGLIFFLIDKRPFVKFHGAQAIAFNICIIPFWILYLIANFIFLALASAIRMPFLGLLGWILAPIIGILVFGTWVFLMYKAYQHEKFKLPIIGNIVEKMVGQ